MVNEHAVESFSDHPLQKFCRCGGINAAAQRADHSVVRTNSSLESLALHLRIMFSVVQFFSELQMSNTKFDSICIPFSVCVTSG